MSTFSQVVDNVVRRAAKPARLLDAQKYVRASIRECQVLAVFARDLIEDEFQTDGSDPYTWTRPTDMRILKTLYYPELDIYPSYAPPGKLQKELREKGLNYYYYGGPTYFALSGVGGNSGIKVQIAYYNYAPKFAYWPAVDNQGNPVYERPAYYDEQELVWYYLQPDGTSYGISLPTLEEEEAAKEKVTNWLLFDWTELIEEGGLAKLFKATADERSIQSFALYKSFQKDVLRGERTETLVD